MLSLATIMVLAATCPQPISAEHARWATGVSRLTAITTGRIGSGSGNSTTTGKHLTIGEYDDARGPLAPSSQEDANGSAIVPGGEILHSLSRRHPAPCAGRSQCASAS